MTIDYSTAVWLAQTIFIVAHVLLPGLIALGVASIHHKLTRRVCKGCGESTKRCVCGD